MNGRSIQENNTSTREVPEAERYPNAEAWVEEQDLVFLVGGRCHACGKHAFPAAPICSSCHSHSIERTRLSRTGRVYAYTTVHVPPVGIAGPYILAYVDLPEDVRILAQIDDPEGRLALGAAVDVNVRVIRTSDDGRPVISYVFRTAA